VSIEPPVTVEIGERIVRFIGVNLLNGVVMVEYDVEPALNASNAGPFGPQLLILTVTDDVSSEVYPTVWEDFRWPSHGPGRTTTRLDRRPPAEARRLHIEVRPVLPDASAPGPTPAELDTVARFDVQLPPEHGQPWLG
jgi:hypothetical protein